MKKLLIICITTLLLLNIAIIDRVHAAGIKVIFNGEIMELSSSPVIENNSILVPLKDIFEAFNMDISWQEHDNGFYISDNERYIRILLDSNVSWVDGEVIGLETPAKMIGKTAFVPVQLIARAFNVTVDWDNGTNTITIKSNEKKKQPISNEDWYKNKVIKVVTGNTFSMALREDGTLSAWGFNSGVFGDGTDKDRLYIESIGNVKDWKDVSTGNYFAVLLKKNGTLWGVGSNYFGELGDGTSKNSRLSPKQIGDSNQWDKVFAKYHRAGAIKKDGSLWVWGLNEAGELGDGTKTNRLKPVKIGKNDWAEVSFGFSHTGAVKKDGTLWTWGFNGFGQLGIGNVKQQNITTPTQIGKERNWQSVSASGNYTIALKKDGTLWAWGVNQFGQMGNGLEEWNKVYNKPIQIGKDSNWAKIATRGSNAYALKKDGTLWMWGGEFNGNLVPTQVEKDKKWTAIAEGSESMAGSISLGVTSDNKVFAWGGNNNGQSAIGPSFVIENPTEIIFPTLVNSSCKPTRVMWDKAELKRGQIGKLAIVKDTPLYKKNNKTGSLEFSRTLKVGQEFRVYSKSNESGIMVYSVGGGYFVGASGDVKYQTPSKSKLAQLNEKCEIK
ncbi:stalk domain-containing protein [Cytobacillus sp. FJAT-54145]|uniref:Stalk domain-containing protein n=1 Tax=Cytobacillus spartinae TaxID=3299023 RepID=A0ABW6KFW5_9BACI